MLKFAGPALLAFAAGISLVVQQALNGNVRTALGSAAWAGFVSYFVGVLAMAALALVMQEPLPSAAAAGRIPWWSWSAGIFGAVFIALGILLVPQLGAATFFALLVAGQMIGSMLFDHFGVLGLPVHEITSLRLLGAVFLVGGVLLIRT